jgi:hypothetical protein
METLKKENQILASKFMNMTEKLIMAGEIARDSISKFNYLEQEKEFICTITEMELICEKEISKIFNTEQEFVWIKNKGLNSDGKYIFEYCSSVYFQPDENSIEEMSRSNIIVLLRCYDVQLCNKKFEKYISKHGLYKPYTRSFIFQANNITELLNFTDKLKNICKVVNLISFTAPTTTRSNRKYYTDENIFEDYLPPGGLQCSLPPGGIYFFDQPSR